MARIMKDSGVEWIGEIPQGWNVMPHKYVMHKEKTLCEHYNGEDIISLTISGVIVRDLTAGGKMPTTFDGYQYVEPNDMLLCLFDIDVTPRCVGIVRNHGITSPAYSRFKVHNGYYNGYYDYLLRFIDDEKVFVHLAKNLRSSLTETDFGAISTIVPPLSEQQKIADFLDRKCSEIDTVIKKTEETIEEYKKLKQSIITEAVTKGVRGDRAMKDSGIEWIGKIPQEWELEKIKRHFANNKGLSITKENLIPFGLPVISYGQIHSPKNDGVSVHSDLIRYVDFSYQEDYPQCRVEQYDFVFADTSEDYAGCGNCVYKRDSTPLFGGYHSIILRSKEKKDNRYLAFLFKTDCWRKQIRESSAGVKVFSVTQKILMNSFMLLPPLDEQQEIVNYLDSKCSEIDKLIEAKQKLLTELQSYKKSVIYEYVTGKKEVE